jgi:hypothetical protein
MAKTLAEVKTVADFIEHLHTNYEPGGVIPSSAKTMLIMYMPLLNLPKKQNNGTAKRKI